MDSETPVLRVTKERCASETTQPAELASLFINLQLFFQIGHWSKEKNPGSAGGLRSMRIQGIFFLRKIGTNLVAIPQSTIAIEFELNFVDNNQTLMFFAKVQERNPREAIAGMD